MNDHRPAARTGRFAGLAVALIIGLVVLALATIRTRTTIERPWMNISLPPEQRANLLLAQMTLDDKLAEVHGDGSGLGPGGFTSGYAGHVPGNARLGIPELYLADGPAGVGDAARGVTVFPAAVNTAATWNPSLAYRFGQIYAAEQAGKGNNVALAPTINILRIPYWGRAFETLTEDPYLNAQMAAAEIRGMQSRHVIATAKHFVANNQEVLRHSIDARVSERALNEIYYPGFRAAAQQGGAGAIMCSYNRINGPFACENADTLSRALKAAWGFDGFVMSDWFATHSTVSAANAGLDMEMPGGAAFASTSEEHFGPALRGAVLSGHVPMSRLNDMVRRILTAMFSVGLFDHPVPDHASSEPANVSTPAHRQFARDLSEQGTVLLKNSGHVLPLTNAVKSVAVIGNDAGGGAQIQGGGSAAVIPSATVTPIQGIRARAGQIVTVKYAQGTPGNLSSLHLDRQPQENIMVQRAVAAARNAGVAVVFAGNWTTEGRDRATLALPGDQDKLIEAVAAVNPHTVVVLNTGAAVLMPWLSRVAGVLEAWYPGQEDGDAIAAVLFGDVNPSGKLPVTFPAGNQQMQARTTLEYPGNGRDVYYHEGILVGYRWYDVTGRQPLFPFGYGLSYTTFSYSHLRVSPAHPNGVRGIVVRFDLTNTGSRAGADVAQVYLGLPVSTGEPPKRLVGFQRVQLNPGETRHVTVLLDPRALAFWDTARHAWATASGDYTVYLGNSSRNISLTDILHIR